MEKSGRGEGREGGRGEKCIARFKTIKNTKKAKMR